MKKLFGIVAVFIFLFIGVGTASAQMGMMRYVGQNSYVAVQPDPSSTIGLALQDIYNSQNIVSQNQVACAAVTDAQFEKLGDAVMGYGITEQQHTAMENMMGGEGSATLKQAHINMGRSYLGCWSNYKAGPVGVPMMGYLNGTSTPTGYVQTNPYYGGPWGMMGGYYSGYHWFGWATMALVWALLILGIVALVRWLKK
jgi:hypothetical protein